MRQLDFYEFTGVFLPGAVTLVGLGVLIPDLKTQLLSLDVSVGSLVLLC